MKAASLRGVLITVGVCIFAASTRLTCLQNEQGKEPANTPWHWGPIAHGSSPAATDRWMYSNPSCPLKLFNERKFCRDAVGCGKKLLLEGDSTMQLLASTLQYLLPIEETTHPCPTDNFCSSTNKNPNSDSKCVHLANDKPIRKLKTCMNKCPPGQEVVVTFIRLHKVHSWREELSRIHL
jgi:hypothetical protein